MSDLPGKKKSIFEDFSVSKVTEVDNSVWVRSDVGTCKGNFFPRQS